MKKSKDPFHKLRVMESVLLFASAMFLIWMLYNLMELASTTS